MGEWYDIPLGAKPKDPRPYLRCDGLLAVMHEAVVLSGEAALFEPEPGGLVYVPFNHGDPELYHVQ